MLERTRRKQLEGILSWHIPDVSPATRQVILDELVNALKVHDQELTVSDCAVAIDLMLRELDRYRFDEPAPRTVEVWQSRLKGPPKILDDHFAKRQYVDRIFNQNILARYEDAMRQRTGMRSSSPPAVHLLTLFRWLWHMTATEQALAQWHLSAG